MTAHSVRWNELADHTPRLDQLARERSDGQFVGIIPPGGTPEHAAYLQARQDAVDAAREWVRKNEWPEAEGDGITDEWIDSVVRGRGPK